MAQKVDLYSLLLAYANKTHAPVIKITTFLDFIGKYAQHYVAEQPEWEIWTRNAGAKFWEDIPALVDAGKCVIQGSATERTVFLAQYHASMISLAYKDDDDSRLPPFPDEQSLKIQLSEEQITVLRLKEDLIDYLNKAETVHYPIIKLEIPDHLYSILTLDSMLPYGLLEAAFLKVRFYLTIAGNRDFVLQKLAVRFHGQEDYPRNMLSDLFQNPGSLVKQFEESGESSYSFWMYLCNLVKDDLRSKTTQISDDITILQAIAIIEQLNIFFNLKAQEAKARETAFEELIAHFMRAPFLYTMGNIIKFEGHDGKPLLEHYSNKDLDEFIAKKTDVPVDQVPELLLITDVKKEQWFILKAKFPLVCMRQLTDARTMVKDAVIQHWLKVLRRYDTEPAMERERDFKDTLLQYLRIQTPILAAMLEYRRITLLFVEMKSDQEAYAEFAKLFDKNTSKMLGLNEILLLKRRTLLSEAHAGLPFWYSFPLFVKIVRFFSGKGKHKQEALTAGAPSSTVKKEKALTFQMVCRQFEDVLVPEGQTLDSYLMKLWDRWARLIKEEDRKNLREDVNSLIRDRIRRTVRMLKPVQITEEYLAQTSMELIQSSSALRQLKNNSMELYVKLYLLKLLKSIPR
jgi:hypothetical protein